MSARHAEARWEGSLMQGKGQMKLGSGAFEGPFSFKTRFEDEPGTNPEELIGAAHAGCFSMAFSALLEEAGFVPDSVETSAQVYLGKTDDGFSITRIELKTEGVVPNIDEEKFQSIAEQAKGGCPVSKALAGVKISLEATLKA